MLFERMIDESVRLKPQVFIGGNFHVHPHPVSSSDLRRLTCVMSCHKTINIRLICFM